MATDTVYICDLCGFKRSQGEDIWKRDYQLQRWGYVKVWGMHDHVLDGEVLLCEGCLGKLRQFIDSLKPKEGA